RRLDDAFEGSSSFCVELNLLAGLVHDLPVKRPVRFELQDPLAPDLKCSIAAQDRVVHTSWRERPLLERTDESHALPPTTEGKTTPLRHRQLQQRARVGDSQGCPHDRVAVFISVRRCPGQDKAQTRASVTLGRIADAVDIDGVHCVTACTRGTRDSRPSSPHSAELASYPRARTDRPSSGGTRSYPVAPWVRRLVPDGSSQGRRPLER